MPRKVEFDCENPEWAAADFARAKTGDAIPVHIRAAFPNTGKRERGRPKGSVQPETKERVTIRLDRELIGRLRQSGPGWQTRVNEALRKVMGL
jgi:uncharacterized protein (DUF4415 family)